MQNDPQSNDPRPNDPRYNNPDNRDPNFGERSHGDPNAGEGYPPNPGYPGEDRGARAYGDSNYSDPSFGRANYASGGRQDPNFGQQYYSDPASTGADRADAADRDARVEKNWELTDASGEPLRWMQLENNGEDIANQWRLESPSSGPPPADWQPVEYQNTYETDTSGRRNWMLPAFITIALLAVLGYIAFLGLSRFPLDGLPAIGSLGGDGSEIAAESPSVDDGAPTVSPALDTMTSTTPVASGEVVTEGVAEDSAADAAEPAATEPPAGDAPTPSPTAAPLPATVAVDAATVTMQYGLNARSEPRVDESTVLYLLDDGTLGYVTDQQGDEWIEMIIVEGEHTGDRVWVSADFVSITEEEVDRSIAEGLGIVEPDTSAAQAAAESALDSATEADADSDTETDAEETDAGVSTTDEADEEVDETTAEPAVVDTGVTGTILGTAGVNARSAPEISADNIVELLPADSTLPATARSEDGEWVQLQREDGSLVWLYAELVSLSEPLETLPLPGEAAPADEEAAAESVAEVEAAPEVTTTETVTSETEPTDTTETAEDAAETDEDAGASSGSTGASPGLGTITTTPGEPVGEVEPDAPFTNVAPDGPAAVVASSLGATVHEQPSVAADVMTSLPNGAVLAAVALSDDGEWVQIELPDGRLGWALRRALRVTPDVLELSASAGASAGSVRGAANANAEEGTGGPVEGTNVTVTTNSRISTDVYAEPVANNRPLARVPASTTLTAVGRTAARDWVLVELEDGTEAWIYLALVETDTQAIRELPVVE